MTVDECKNQLSILAEHGFKVQNKYLCPFCMRYITDPDKISREDAPQDFLGGTKIALTCKDCNNKFGGQIDNQLINAIKIDEESFLPENFESRIELQSGSSKGKTIRAILKDEGNSLEIILLPEHNDPKLLDAEWQAIESGDIKEVCFTTARITKKVYNGKREAALIKNAYVILFSYFGYSFLLNPFYDRIREQLVKPLEDIIPGGLVSNEGALGEIPDGVYVSDIVPLRGFLVAFTLKRRWNHHYCVFIPAINNGYESAIDKLRVIDRDFNFVVYQVERSTEFWRNKDTITALINWANSKEIGWLEVVS